MSAAARLEAEIAAAGALRFSRFMEVALYDRECGYYRGARKVFGREGDFYTAAQSTGNAPQALANVQRDSLVKLRQEKGLWFAVNRAGPFIMSSQGPVK